MMNLVHYDIHIIVRNLVSLKTKYRETDEALVTLAMNMGELIHIMPHQAIQQRKLYRHQRTLADAIAALEYRLRIHPNYADLQVGSPGKDQQCCKSSNH